VPEGFTPGVENSGKGLGLALLEKGKKKAEKSEGGGDILAFGIAQGAGQKGKIGSVDDGVYI
jgi:hypothetical protein